MKRSFEIFVTNNFSIFWRSAALKRTIIIILGNFLFPGSYGAQTLVSGYIGFMTYKMGLSGNFSLLQCK